MVLRTVVGGVLTAVVLTVPVAGGATGRDSDERPDLQQQLDRVRDSGAVAVLARVRHGDAVWRGASGAAELGSHRPVAVRSRFRAGSVIKTFLATVVLQLVADGRIGLEDPVEEWLPGVVPGGDQVTLRHLLGHTSGLHDYLDTLPMPPQESFLDNRWRTWEAAELVGRAVARPPVFWPPGSDFDYSNTNYVLLGMVVEAVTGRTYAEEVRRRVVVPLRLHGTSIPATWPRIRGPHPHGYVPVERAGELRLVDYTEMNPSVMGASGALVSTTADLERFFRALLTGRLLPDHLLAQMTTPSVPAASYGLGLDWLDLGCGVRAYGHDGDALAYRAWSFVADGADRQATVALTPNFSGDPDPTVLELLETALCP